MSDNISQIESMPEVNEPIRTAINGIRVIALYMIVCVHCCFIGNNPDNIEKFILGLAACIGMVGVPLYFFVSGFLFDYTKYKTFGQMISHKLKGLIVPWVCSAIYMWLFENKLFHASHTSILEYFIGINSILWYLTVLIIFYIIFWCIRTNAPLILLAISGVVYHYLAAYGGFILPSIISSILNWFLFFWFGNVVRKNNIWERLLQTIKSKNYNIIASLATIGGGGACIMIKICTGHISGYIDVLSYPLEICGLISIIGFSNKFPDKLQKINAKLSGYTFSVYLYHLPFATIANYLLSKFRIMNYLLLVRPVLVIAVTMLIFVLYKKIFKNIVLLRIAGLYR